MNKKGVTLIELMAVIAIIAMLAIMITPGVVSLRNSVLESSYENKVSQIVNAAIDYGTQNVHELPSPVSSTYMPGDYSYNSTDCAIRNVNFLINNGYLNVSNSYTVNDGVRNATFTDPRDNSSMNNKLVCIRFDNNSAIDREIIAYIIENEEG